MGRYIYLSFWPEIQWIKKDEKNLHILWRHKNERVEKKKTRFHFPKSEFVPLFIPRSFPEPPKTKGLFLRALFARFFSVLLKGKSNEDINLT